MDKLFGLKGYLLSTSSTSNAMSVYNTTKARELKTKFVASNKNMLKGRPFGGEGEERSEYF